MASEASLLSEYNPVYQTPCFSDASLMHLQSSSTYSDALHIGLHMLCDSTCYVTPHHPLHPHLCTCCPCLFVCLFVYLCHWHTCCLFVCLFPLPDCFC